jgi:hypothetical protein
MSDPQHLEVAKINQALLGSAQTGDFRAVERLLALGADANVKTSDGDPALILAAGAHWSIDDADALKTVNALLAKGADVNAKGANGGTALIGAAHSDRIEVARALIAKGAQLNAVDKWGGTALKASEGNEVHDFLVKAGAVDPPPPSLSQLPDLAALRADAVKFQAMIDDESLKPASRDVVRSFKAVTDNLIAALVLARDCEALRAAEPTLLPGTYRLYPSGELSRAVATQCR